MMPRDTSLSDGKCKFFLSGRHTSRFFFLLDRTMKRRYKALGGVIVAVVVVRSERRWLLDDLVA